jgi:hypothetical protein
MRKLKIVYRKTADLKPYLKNSRTHSKAQVAQIAAAIREFGWTNPILTDDDGGIIAGHGRLLAAIELDMPEVPTVPLIGLTEPQRRAYVIADNKLAENAGWDDELRNAELSDLSNLGFDLTVLGFSLTELSDLFPTGEAADPGEGDDAGIEYQEQFAIIVMCDDEADQTQKYDDLVAEGFRCKVLVN